MRGLSSRTHCYSASSPASTHFSSPTAHRNQRTHAGFDSCLSSGNSHRRSSSVCARAIIHAHLLSVCMNFTSWVLFFLPRCGRTLRPKTSLKVSDVSVATRTSRPHMFPRTAGGFAVQLSPHETHIVWESLLNWL